MPIRKGSASVVSAQLRIGPAEHSDSVPSRETTGGPDVEARFRVLCVSPEREDLNALSFILKGSLFQMIEARTRQQAVTSLCRDRMNVVICEGTLPDGTWKDILGYIAELPDPPLLVVTSKLADENLWAEVLNLGGFDVLAKPFTAQEVNYVLAAALRRGAIGPNTYHDTRYVAAVG